LNKIIHKIGATIITLVTTINTFNVLPAIAQVTGTRTPEAIPLVTFADVTGIFSRVLNTLFILFFIIAGFYFFWGAADYLMQKPDDGKKKLVNATIAVIIALVSGSIPIVLRAIIAGS